MRKIKTRIAQSQNEQMNTSFFIYFCLSIFFGRVKVVIILISSFELFQIEIKKQGDDEDLSMQDLAMLG